MNPAPPQVTASATVVAASSGGWEACSSTSSPTTPAGFNGEFVRAVSCQLGSITPRGSESMRQAVLRDLYNERNVYLTKQRLAQISPNERLYLQDVLREIDKHEMAEATLKNGELWSRIDALAAKVLAHQAR